MHRSTKSSCLKDLILFIILVIRTSAGIGVWEWFGMGPIELPKILDNGYARRFDSISELVGKQPGSVKISTIFLEVQVADVTDSKAVLENFLFQWSICQMTFYVCGTQV